MLGGFRLLQLALRDGAPEAGVGGANPDAGTAATWPEVLRAKGRQPRVAGTGSADVANPLLRVYLAGARETQLADGGSVPPGSYGLSVCLSRETLFAQGLFGYWQGGRGRLKSEREYTRG